VDELLISPAAFVAFIVNVYGCPAVRPGIVITVLLVITGKLGIFAGVDETVYVSGGAYPVFVGAMNEIVADNC